MLHNRQAPGRDFHKHFSLAPARSDTITASSTASATAATRNPPPHPDPYKTGPQARKATSRAPHLSLMPLSLPCPKQQSKRDRATRTANSKASATQQTTQQPQLAPPHLKPRMGTDGEGRRNPARLCTTAVRCLGSHIPPASTPHFPLRGAGHEQEHVRRRHERGGRSAKRSRTLPTLALRTRRTLGLRSIGGATMSLSSQEGGTTGRMRRPCFDSARAYVTCVTGTALYP